jgi:hypothetical protein
MRGMHKWEYCAVYVAIYREGTGGPPRELLEISLPGAHRASVTHAFGSVGLLNQLGSEGWELVDVESGAFYLKRQKASAQA